MDGFQTSGDQCAAGGWPCGRAPPGAAGELALIAIPCLNEADVIADVISQILDDDGLESPRLVVADGGSTDGTIDIVRDIAARDPRVILVANPRRLQSAGVNLAALQADDDSPWLLRIDAHADYPPRYASTLIAEARRTGAASVVVSMRTQGTSGFQRAVAAAQNSLLGTGGSAHRLAGRSGWVAHGHHALFRRAAFLASGGYDETFSHNEDAELDVRLVRQGAGIWLTDRVAIGYHPRATAYALWKQYVNYGKGRARTVAKHRVRLKLRQALPLAVAPAVALAAASPWSWPLALPALAWGLASVGYAVGRGLIKSDPGSFWCWAPAMIMHLGWSVGFWSQVFASVETPALARSPVPVRAT